MSTIAILGLCWGVFLVAFVIGLALGRWFGKTPENSRFYHKVRALNRSIGYNAALADAHALGLHWQIIKRMEFARQQRAKLEDWPETMPEPVATPDLTHDEYGK